MKHCLVFFAFLLVLSSCQQKNIDPLLAIEGKWNGEWSYLLIKNDTFRTILNKPNEPNKIFNNVFSRTLIKEH